MILEIDASHSRIWAFLCLSCMLLLSGCLSSARFIEGKEELSYLEGEDKLLIRFDHSETSIGRYPNEEEFIEKKVKEKNKEEKGSGDEWEKNWRSYKKKEFQPAFVLNLDETIRKKGIQLTRKKETEYVIILNVQRLELGYYEGVAAEPAKISTRMKIVKNGKADEPLTVLEKREVSGKAYVTRKERLRSAFKEAATYYARYFQKHLDPSS